MSLTYSLNRRLSAETWYLMSVGALAQRQSCPACVSVSTDCVHERKDRSYLLLNERCTGQMEKERPGWLTWNAEKATFSLILYSRREKDPPIPGTDLRS